MVCPRCIDAIQEIMQELDLEVADIELGRVEVQNLPEDFNFAMLDQQLENRGFERLLDKNAQLVERIKAVVIDMVHFADKMPVVKNSSYLSNKLDVSYAQLSKAFSKSEETTIEKYIILQKIERVKELISYGEHTLSEISTMLAYSSVQHLSNQFRAVTGQSVTAYKNSGQKNRSSLDEI